MYFEHCCFFQIMAVNGEIYNHRELIDSATDFVPRTGSDCEALMALYEKGTRDSIQYVGNMYIFHLPCGHPQIITCCCDFVI